MSELYTVAAVACGAAIGGVLRLLVAQVVLARFRPARSHWATLLINVTGSFLIGVVLQLARARGLDPLAATFLTTGILGGYTTFSAFAYEALHLALRPAQLLAAVYTAGSVALSIAGVCLGAAVVRAAA